MGETVLSHLRLDILVSHPDGPVDETQVIRPILETRSPILKIGEVSHETAITSLPGTLPIG